MKFMLDTNICIYLIKKKPVEVLHHLQKIPIDKICISSITLSELEYGVQKSSNPTKNKLALAEFVAPLEVLQYEESAAAKYGEIRAMLEAKGSIIGGMDMLIAAHCLSTNLILVTNNVREFKRVPHLKIENWV